MALAKSKFNLGLYDCSAENNLIKTFINQVLLRIAKYLNLHKSTIGRYLKSGNFLLNKYFVLLLRIRSKIN